MADKRQVMKKERGAKNFGKWKYYVVHDVLEPSGGKIYGKKLSPALHSRFQLDKAIRRMKLGMPGVELYGATHRSRLQKGVNHG